MFSRLIKFSLDHAALVLLLAGVLLVFVAVRLPRTPVDVFPDLNRPTVTIMTEAEGLAPPEVELRVSFPIETQMNGVAASHHLAEDTYEVTRLYVACTRAMAGLERRSSVASIFARPTASAKFSS